MLLSTMDSQLEAVRQDIRDVKGKIAKTEQKLAAAERAGTKGVEDEKYFRGRLEKLDSQLVSLQEKENILLRSQAPSKPCIQLVLTSLPVSTSFVLHVVEAWIKHKMRINTGCTAQLWGYSP